MIKFSYDPEVRAVYVYVNEKLNIDHTDVIQHNNPFVAIDRDVNDQIIGVEILLPEKTVLEDLEEIEARSPDLFEALAKEDKSLIKKDKPRKEVDPDIYESWGRDN